jgi:hypothetical protein
MPSLAPTPVTQPTNASGPMAAWNSILPGFSNLTNTATNNAQSDLSGNLPTDVINNIQNQAAAWGVTNGMPGVSGNSLTGQNGLANLGLTSLNLQNTGQQDLLGLLGGYSGTVAPTTGQAIQNQQFTQSQGQQANEFNAQNALAQFNAAVNAAGLFNPQG